MYIITDLLFWSGIAAAGYQHVGYLDYPKRRKHYDDFFGKVLQVVELDVLSWKFVKKSVSKLTFMDPPIGPETQPQLKPVKS
jgi:hypothetical protein